MTPERAIANLIEDLLEDGADAYQVIEALLGTAVALATVEGCEDYLAARWAAYALAQQWPAA